MKEEWMKRHLIWPEVEDDLFMMSITPKSRDIRYLVAHCTGTFTTADVNGIVRYWKRTLGWKNPGYHYLIDRQGRIHNLLPEHQIANGVKGYNAQSIHVSYIGGLSDDNRTDMQKANMLYLFRKLKKKYPQAEILGHRDFPGVAKACPQFDAREEYKDL